MSKEKNLYYIPVICNLEVKIVEVPVRKCTVLPSGELYVPSCFGFEKALPAGDWFDREEEAYNSARLWAEDKLREQENNLRTLKANTLGCFEVVDRNPLRDSDNNTAMYPLDDELAVGPWW